MTTAENLNRIINAKSDIKQAIENKGVEVGDITIDKYAEKVKQIAPKVVLRDGTKFRSSTFIFDALDEPMTSMFDTSQMTDMSYMFDDCENFFGVILEKWDFSNVTNMSNMFSNCGSLMYVKLNNNFVDRLIASGSVSKENREKLAAARQMMSETRNIHIIKGERKTEHV